MKKVIIFPPGEPGSRPTAPAVQQPVKPAAGTTLWQRAEKAWNAGKMMEAESLYSELLQGTAGPRGQEELACTRLTEAALANRHFPAALSALQKWRAINPSVAGQKDWLTKWGKTLMGLPAVEAQSLAQAASSDSSAPLLLKSQALGVQMLTVRGNSMLDSAQSLTSLYGKASRSDKAGMERLLLPLAGEATEERLKSILQYTLPDTDQTFPWSVLLLDQARREMADLRLRGQDGTPPTLERLGDGTCFAYQPLVRDALASPGSGSRSWVPLASRVPMNSGCYTLAVPMSGTPALAKYGNLIAAGARAAQTDLRRSGVNVELHLLDTENPQWLSLLDELPARCVTVGGPLTKPRFKQVKDRQMTSRRAFFTFLSALGDGEEGRTAWRFFPSERDQVNTMLRFARDAGAARFAVLYPEDSFGRKKAELFKGMAPNCYALSYPPKNTAAWNNIAAQLVGKDAQNAADPRFDALFLPDSWSNAAVMIPCLIFNGEQRMLLMGTALWEHGMSQGPVIDSSNLRLAVFPGAWNKANPTPAASNLTALLDEAGESRADMWSGLGYDFVRFAAALDLQPGWNAAGVNAALGSARQINWSMAPLLWSPDGLASQDMFVFTPKGIPVGIAPGEMKTRIGQVRAVCARRAAAQKGKAAQ
ncbi:MAG: hypothetical protein IKX79_00110 [Desulfovibrionaceae bacterium]|nr:hypothetical protein [Desulfovibrionaceae bacterium]